MWVGFINECWFILIHYLELFLITDGFYNFALNLLEILN